MSENRLAGVYCTIVAQNYLPQALALYESVRAQEPERDFVLLVVDGDRRELADARPRMTVMGRDDLGVNPAEFDNLAMIYDVVELSTAVKPLLLRRLLADYEQAIYLDPDMQVVSPLRELEPAIRDHGIVLTPHFLRPIPPGSSYISEVHSLTVGVHNLGFCGVGQEGIEFLDWWWSHLQRECLIYPLLGIFVDQKWTDVGANYFGAHSLRHAGYNVGPWNLLERRIDYSEDGFTVGGGDALRLLHFSGFNANDPEAISERLSADMHDATDSEAFRELSRQYAETVLRLERELGPAPSYAFAEDSRGKAISKRLRRQYRADLLVASDPAPLPSAFAAADSDAFAAWRRSARVRKLRLTAGDVAIAAKYALPDTFIWFKRRFPGGFKSSRERLLAAANVRR